MQPLVEGEGVITELGTFTLLLDVSSRRRQKQWKFAQPIQAFALPLPPFFFVLQCSTSTSIIDEYRTVL